MKVFFKFKIIFGFILSTLFLMMQCDHFPLDFLTPHNFNLDSSAHEIEVKTKQGAWLDGLSINGNEEQYVGLDYRIDNKDTTVYYNDYTVRYQKDGEAVSAVEIIGEWFNIKSPDRVTTQISIDQNNSLIDRSLKISLATGTESHFITVYQYRKQ